MATKQVAPAQVDAFINGPATRVDDNVDIGAEAGESGSGGGFRVNFGTIKGLTPIPDGKYDVVIREVKPGTSQAKLPKMDLTLVIEDAEDETLNGRKVYDTLSFAENAMWRVKAFLLALGYEDDFDGEITPADLEGEHLVVTVALDTQTKINTETGKPYEPRTRVKAFAPAGSNATIDDVL
jgi:hypothetical protein